MMGAAAKETDRDLHVLLERTSYLTHGQDNLMRQMRKVLQLLGVHSQKNIRGWAYHGFNPSNSLRSSIVSNSSECARIKQGARRDRSMQEAIQHHITDLVKSLEFNASDIPDLIIAHGIANESKTAEIGQLSTTEDQVSALIAHVLTCDYDGMDRFLKILSKDYSQLEKKIRGMFDTVHNDINEVTMPCAVCELKERCDVKHVYNYLFEKNMISSRLHRIIAYMKCPLKDQAAAWDDLLKELSLHPNQLAIEVLIQALGHHDGHQNATITLMLKRLFRKNKPLTCRCGNAFSPSSSPASTLPFESSIESMECVNEDIDTDIVSNCDIEDMATNFASNRHNEDMATNIASNHNNKDMATNIASNHNNQDMATNIACNHKNQDMATDIASNHNNQDMATSTARNSDNQDMATNIASNHNNQHMATNIASNHNNKDMATNIASNHNNQHMATNIACNHNNQDMATDIASNHNNQDMATSTARNRDNQDMATNIASNHNNQHMATNIASNHNNQDMATSTARNRDNQDMATNIASNHNNQHMATNIASNHNNQHMATNIASNHNNQDMATNIASNHNNQDMATNIASNHNNQHMATNIASNHNNQHMATNIASNHNNQHMATNIASNCINQDMASDIASNCQIYTDRSIRNVNHDFVINTGEKALTMTYNDTDKGLRGFGIKPNEFIERPNGLKTQQAQKAPERHGESQIQCPEYSPVEALNASDIKLTHDGKQFDHISKSNSMEQIHESSPKCRGSDENLDMKYDNVSTMKEAAQSERKEKKFSRKPYDIRKLKDKSQRERRVEERQITETKLCNSFDGNLGERIGGRSFNRQT